MKKYSPSKGMILYAIDNGLPADAPEYVREALIMSQRGRHYLHVMGGSSSRYATLGDDGHAQPGERTIPLTADQAMRWAVEAMPADAIERMRNPMTDAGPRFRTNANLTPGMMAWIKRRAVLDGIDASAVMRAAIREYADAHPLGE